VNDDRRGRRASERRRERDRARQSSDDDERGTSPGSPVVEPLPSASDSGRGDTDLPLITGGVREIEGGDGGTKPAKKRPPIETSREADPEQSFIKAVRASTMEERRAAEITAVREAPDRPPKRGGHIVVLEGPDKGGEADIELFPSLVGRLPTAEIGLSDPSVSVRHLELRFNDGIFTALDLGSTSGTLLNGEVVGGEVELHHGDVLALGKSELRFIRGDKLPQPRPEPAPEPEQPPIEPTEKLPTKVTKAAAAMKPSERTRAAAEAEVHAMRARVRRRAVRVMTACAALLVLALAAKIVRDKFFTDKAPAQIRAQVAELLADGRNRLRAQDVDGARASAQTVLALDADNEDAKSLARMADTEAEARDAIALALRLGDEERDVEAAQILKRVPDASVFAPTRDRLKRTLDDRGRVRSKRSIEAMLDLGRVADALAAAQKHVASWPDDEEGKALLERAQAAQAAIPKNPGLAAARAAFAAGNIDEARHVAQDNNLTGYVRDLDAFQASLAKGKAALSRFDEDAADSLDVAFRLLGALGADASSPIFADVRKPYAKALLVSGTAQLDQNPCAAARKLYKAARVTPDDAAVQTKLRELDDRAVAALDRARASKHQDADRAAATAREALCLAKTGSHTYDELRALSRL
jgi:hypothetical protein